MRLFIDLPAEQSERRPSSQASPSLQLVKQLMQQAPGHEWHFLLPTQSDCSTTQLKTELSPLGAKVEIHLFSTPERDPSEGRSISDLLFADFIQQQRPDALIQLMPTRASFAWPEALIAGFPIYSLDQEQEISDILRQLYDSTPAKPSPDSGLPHDFMAVLASKVRLHASDDELVRDIARALAYNRRPAQRQLLLDVSVLACSDAKSGIQRVVRSIFIELFQNPPAHLTVRAIRFHDGSYCYADNFEAQAVNAPGGCEEAPIDFHQGDIYLALDLNMNISQQVAPLHKDMGSRGVELFFIVYDMLPIQHPEWWHNEISPMFRTWLEAISRNASGLCCISGAVAQEVSIWLSQHPPERVRPGPKVRSFHLGADMENSMPSLGLPDTANEVLDAIQNSYSFLMVSTIEPRKGHAQTLDAFELLWRDGCDVKLVIVGRRGWLVDTLVQRMTDHPEAGRRLLWLEGISDEYLEKIYAASTCLIAASEGEGFGLPLIEAAQHRLPIIARALPVFREVASDFAWFFEGDTPQALAETIKTWLDLFATDRFPKSAGMPWLTWQQSAEQLLVAIQEITGQTLVQNTTVASNFTDDDALHH